MTPQLTVPPGAWSCHIEIAMKLSDGAISMVFPSVSNTARGPPFIPSVILGVFESKLRRKKIIGFSILISKSWGKNQWKKKTMLNTDCNLKIMTKIIEFTRQFVYRNLQPFCLPDWGSPELLMYFELGNLETQPTSDWSISGRSRSEGKVQVGNQQSGSRSSHLHRANGVVFVTFNLQEIPNVLQLEYVFVKEISLISPFQR